MKIKTPLAMMLAGVLLSSAGLVIAADQDRDQTRDKLQTKDQTQDMLQDRDMIYGYELMTAKERAEHRAKMASFKTEQEREAYREEHHKLMQARAKERGVDIPEIPRQRGTGPGTGMRSGGTGSGGAGSGGGAGKGR